MQGQGGRRGSNLIPPGALGRSAGRTSDEVAAAVTTAVSKAGREISMILRDRARIRLWLGFIAREDLRMFDPTKLLGELLENQASPAAAGRLDAAAGSSGLTAAGNPLQQLLAGLGGGASSPGASGTGGSGFGGMLGSLIGVAQQAVGSTAQQVQSNNPMAVGGLGALAGALLGGGKGAVGGGVMAVLGSLAYSALQRASQPATPAAAGTGGAAPTGNGAGAAVGDVMTAGTEDIHATATLLLRAMISAAKADGSIDQQEMDRILGKLKDAGSDPEARDFVLAEMRRPLDIDGLVAEVKTPQQAVQVYAASLLAIDVDSPAEKDYLARLAQALRLPPQAAEHIHDSLGVSV